MAIGDCEVHMWTPGQMVPMDLFICTLNFFSD